MNKEDMYGFWFLLFIGFIFCLGTLWVSNTSFCLNYRKDMTDYIERFKWCSTRIDYLNESK